MILRLLYDFNWHVQEEGSFDCRNKSSIRLETPVLKWSRRKKKNLWRMPSTRLTLKVDNSSCASQQLSLIIYSQAKEGKFFFALFYFQVQTKLFDTVRSSLWSRGFITVIYCLNMMTRHFSRKQTQKKGSDNWNLLLCECFWRPLLSGNFLFDESLESRQIVIEKGTLTQDFGESESTVRLHTTLNKKRCLSTESNDFYLLQTLSSDCWLLPDKSKPPKNAGIVVIWMMDRQR